MANVQSPELQSKIADWRRKCADGTATMEEMKQAVARLRGDRRNAAAAPSKTSRAKGPARSTDELLGELSAL